MCVSFLLIRKKMCKLGHLQTLSVSNSNSRGDATLAPVFLFSIFILLNDAKCLNKWNNFATLKEMI